MTPEAKRRTVLVPVLVLLQLAVLGVMAGKREYIRAFGKEVYLRTAPIDPRDPFRGDFVRLDYPMSRVSPSQMRGGVAEHMKERDHPVYAVLKPSGRGVYSLDYLTDARPEEGQFLKGRTNRRWSSWRGTGLRVRYGIEQYFVQQGAGLAIEERRGARNELQVPMEVRVALGGDGTGVIKDFRWSPLGIQLEVVRFNRRGRDNQPEHPDQPLSPRLRLTLRNVSDREMTLADPAGPCGLTMEPADGSVDLRPPASAACDEEAGAGSKTIRLASERDHSLELEMSDPRWHVLQEDQPIEIGALERRTLFRLIYHSSPAEQAGTDHWVGELPSPAFNAFGRID